jgi:hypothetical protein
MEQKPYAIIAIVAELFLSGVVTMAIGVPHVMACIPAPGEGYACMSTQQHATIQPVKCVWSHPGFGCDYCTNDDCGSAFVTTPHIQTVDSCNGIGNCNGSPGGGSGNSGGGDNGDNAFVQHPTTQQIAYTQVDDGCNGHWAFSFPPRCLSN